MNQRKLYICKSGGRVYKEAGAKECDLDLIIVKTKLSFKISVRNCACSHVPKRYNNFTARNTYYNCKFSSYTAQRVIKCIVNYLLSLLSSSHYCLFVSIFSKGQLPFCDKPYLHCRCKGLIYI